MPPKGTCLSCTDADIEAAVKFMVGTTYPSRNNVR
jgi:cytochrome c5